MKLLTFVVPCYNSESYMRRCIDSLLTGGKDVEIIIVNDGSTDVTGEIASEYEANYPEIVRAVQKENGGHGSGVNTGIALASGKYFKVVDSDDWVDADAYQSVLNALREENAPDLLVCNYVYNHLLEGRKKIMGYYNVFPEKRIFSWDEIRRFYPSQYLIMHALIFRTEILRQAHVVLPEHTFYVDNLFAYQPLPYVKTIRYLSVDFYQYFIGRDDQSVNERVMMKRIDQQIKVTELVAESADLDEVRKVHPKLANYMRRNISIMLAISSIHLLLIHTDEALEKRKKMWETIRKLNGPLYYRLRFGTLSGFTYLPGPIGAKLTVSGYGLAKKIYQFQ